MENKKDNNQKVKKPKFQIPDSKFQIPIKILLYYSVIFSIALFVISADKFLGGLA